MKLGFDRVDITPPLPVRLSGFGKLRWAHQVHDSIYARLFLFQDQKEETLLVQLDLVAVDDVLVSYVAEKTKIAKDHLVLMAIHTHSAPTGTLNTCDGHLAGMDSIFGELNTSYCERIAEQISESLKKIRMDMKNFQYRILKGKVSGLGTDRHDPALPCDEDALLIEFCREDQKRALMLRLACHPTVLNQENLEITADFPGTLEGLFLEYDQVAYVNGSCGNMSTRFTRKGSGFEEAMRFGKLIERQIRPLLKSDEPFKADFSLDIKQRIFDLPVRRTDSPEEAQKKLAAAQKKLEDGYRSKLDDKAIRLLQSAVEGAQTNLLGSQMLSSLDILHLPISWIRLSSVNLITLPVELFSELSRPLKEELNAEFIGYTNGYFFYMPDKKAYRDQVYEALSSPFEEGCAELLMEQISAWVKAKPVSEKQL